MGSSVASLVGTGIGLGFVHVMTGPDHLSALATLSANVGNCQAFSLGVRWGIGHSTGLLFVGVVLICLSNDDKVEMPHKLTIVFESFVGIFMLLLGCFGLYRAWQKRPPTFESATFNELPVTSDDERPEYMSSTEEDNPSPDSAHVNVSELHSELTLSVDGEPEPLVGSCTGIKWCLQNLSTRTISVLIGIVHGLAGPGGVLGVIPAVQIKDWRLSSIYLGSFCLSSTIVMGCFAATYGSFSAIIGRDGQWKFRVECFSASLSLLVGVMWLTLLSLGQLENLFP